MATTIPEDYDDDDHGYRYMAANLSNSSLPDDLYEDKSTMEAIGLRQTSLAQIGEKKRFRPPTMIQAPFMKNSASRSPSMTSFVSTSSGDRGFQPPYMNHPQQYHPQQYQNHPHHQQHPHHNSQYPPQNPQYPPQNAHYRPPQNFQPPIHYNQAQRSGQSLISPQSSATHLPQPRRQQGTLTPSSSFAVQESEQLPITPESIAEDNDSRNSELHSKNETLQKANDELNNKIEILEKLVKDREQELRLKDNIIEAKNKQLEVREEKLANKSKQLEALNESQSNEELTKLKSTNEKLSNKILQLLKDQEQVKSDEQDKAAKVNKDLSMKIVSLLQEIEILRSEKHNMGGIPLQSPRPDNHTKTLKDLTREELFKAEFLNTLDTLNQNQQYYENKIKNLQETVEQHKLLIKNVSNLKKNYTVATKKGLKVIDIVPSTLEQ